MTAYIDHRQVRRGFDRVARHYADSAGIEQEVGRRMLERLDYVRIDPARVLDVGCGAAGQIAALRERYRNATVIGLDISLEMLRSGLSSGKRLRWLMPFLRSTQGERVAADAARLPLASGQMQLLWSSLLLHWLDDPLVALAEMHRVLSNDGLLMFSTFGPDTLRELRQAGQGRCGATQRFIDMHDLGDMLVHLGFADPVMDMEVIRLEYGALDQLFADLRDASPGCQMLDRGRGLQGKVAWQGMCERYESMRRDGKLPATLEIVYGHAWKVPPKHTPDGRAVIDFRPRKSG